MRASASGGVAALGGDLFLSRTITDSFAVVRLPDYGGVTVYADNQPVARTDARGRALVPRLRAYEPNRIGIEHTDLPLDAHVDAVEREAVPYYRSGVAVVFPVTPGRGGVITVELENGQYLPAGAVASIAGRDESFPVGLRGEIYLTGLAASNRVRIRWREQTCEVIVAFSPGNDPQPHLGTHLCKGVRP